MRWTGFWIVPLVLGCCDAADVRPAANWNDDRGEPPKPLGLRSVISRALSRVRESTRDRRLAGDLWLETVDSDRRANDDGSTATSGPLSDDLVAQADAVFDNHQLSWRDAVVRGLDLNVYKDREKQRYVLGITRRTGDSQGAVTRTFGVGRRRMQMFFMLPVMYKLGVITTLLTGLVVLTLKGVTIGVILLIIALSSIVAKLSKLHNPYASAPMPAFSGWSGYYHDPYDRSSQHQPLPPLHDKNIHVHVHTGPGPVPPAVSYAKSPPPPMPQLADDDEVNNYNNNYYYNGGGGAYWNRPGEEYYNAPAMNHYHRGDNHQLGAESTTASNSVYQQWLG